MGSRMAAGPNSLVRPGRNALAAPAQMVVGWLLDLPRLAYAYPEDQDCQLLGSPRLAYKHCW